MKKLLLIALAITLPATALAQMEQDCYGWEDGATVLGTYNPQYMFLANSVAQAYLGTHSLEIYETGGATTPQAYVAWITPLYTGQTVTVTLQTYDLSTGGNPSVRIWGHWTPVGGDVLSYNSSAGGSNTYSGGTTWTPLTYTWTCDALHNGMGLVIEVRPYNATPWLGSNWVDQICVTHPGLSAVVFPDQQIVPATDSTWGSVKGLYR